jgi:glyoxylase-like metal-dependent hydrolase (beta-lactamase superfamily II)
LCYVLSSMTRQAETPLARKVYDKIYKIELPIPFAPRTTNVFFVDEPPRTLIDTGVKTDACFKALENGLRSLGFDVASIERILITHGHIDHHGQAKRLSSLSGAPIYIHPLEYGRIRSIIHSLGFLKAVLLRNGVPETFVGEALHYIEVAQKMGDSLDEASFLTDGDPVPFASMRWRTIQCPGHSPGLICFYWPEKGVLFSGDHLLNAITPNPLLNVSGSLHQPLRYPSLRAYIDSLQKINELPITLVLPAHGDEVRDAKGLIRGVLRHHEQRMELIGSLISHREKTAYEVCTKVFPEGSPFEVFLGMSEVLGHLDILRENGRIGSRERGGREYYFRASGGPVSFQT